ncbi:MAG: restriction endonuclease subunit S [Clostridia bacterium]|nr:restriction endonuclease subunit S [Clostridia bacterium]
MNLDIAKWERFYLGRLFDIKKGKRLTAEDQEEGKNIYIGAIDSNNGVANHIGQIPIHDGNTISLSYNGSVGEAFYQPEPYWATDDVNALYSRYEGFNKYIGLFFVTVIRQEKYRFSYGRKWTLDSMNATDICLPVQRNSDGSPFVDISHRYSDGGFVPDWRFMEDYIKSLHHKSLTTKNSPDNCLNLNIERWKFFFLKDICNITMGNKMDISAMAKDNPEINFIGRSSDNNGVAGKVDIVVDENGHTIAPYPAGCITVALGGSLGSTFLQREPFYTSQNVSVLEFDEAVSEAAKLFLCTLIHNESKYKYFPFGRELNTHIRNDYGFTLPVDSSGNPDWQFMEDYIKALPYGDRLEE